MKAVGSSERPGAVDDRFGGWVQPVESGLPWVVATR